MNKIEESEPQGQSHDKMYFDSIYSEYQNEHQQIVKDLQEKFVEEQLKKISDNITF